MKQNNILSLLPVATIILLVASVLPPAGSRASELEREQRLAEQTVDGIFAGEPVMLQAEGHDFPGIFMEAEGVPERGAAIILHGRGTHPDRGQVAGPLRTTLPAHGWTTLLPNMHPASSQLQIAGADHYFEEYHGALATGTSAWLNSLPEAAN